MIQGTSKKVLGIARTAVRPSHRRRDAAMMAPVDVLLVEDDPSIARSLSDSLEAAGCTVTHVATGGAATTADLGDIVLLDLGLPDMDGYDVCRVIRERSSIPIIVITARGEEFDRVLGLELGADDYVVKPFGFRELLARMRAVRRRFEGASGEIEPADDAAELLRCGPLSVDRRTHRVTLDREVGADEIALTPKEFSLLAYLLEDPGAVRTRTDIIEHVWDANWFGPTKTLDAHVAGIRRKLGDPRWVTAVRGVGFRIEAPDR
jgi:DNA-binding response OmpR family regulator